jgi:dienelactone hydrolase
MRFAAVSLLLATTTLAGAAQYRTLNDRFDAPRVTSREAWVPRARYIREHILVSAGLVPMPDKTPLRPVVFDDIRHADYIVSKAYFESLPGFFVTGNLYRPIGEGPFPAILSPHGHWANGRLESSAITSGPGRAIGLARQGFVVFTHDMIGYNDSRQLTHAFGGRRENLWGLSLSGLQLWNSIRALDFLETLPYVRRDGFGVTGESGGGTQTFLLAAVDDRVAVAAPVNMISLHMQGGCLCENLPGLRLDTTNVEIAAAMAPRPLLMVSATGDWTAETLEVEYPAVRSIYALFDAAPRVHAIRVNAEHNYNKESREAMYAWMARWMQNAPPDTRRVERSFEPDKLPDLLVFYGRSVPDGAATTAQITDRWIAAARAQLASADRSVLGTALRHTLGYGEGIPASADSKPAAQRRRTVFLAGVDPELEAGFRKAGMDVRAVAFTPFDAEAAGRIRHFDTYNRTAASQRVADIVSALRESPSAILVADGDAALAGFLAAAIVPVSRAILDVRGFDTSSDTAFLDRVYIPGLRRAGDFQTAAAIGRGNLVIHDSGERFHVEGVSIESRRLSAREIVALARK